MGKPIMWGKQMVVPKTDTANTWLLLFYFFIIFGIYDNGHERRPLRVEFPPSPWALEGSSGS